MEWPPINSKILGYLKNIEYYTDAIFDIGAYHGNWTYSMKQIYNDCKYFLFEGIEYSELNKFRNNNDVKVFNVILNDKAEQVNWYQMKNTGDSFFREKTHHFLNCEIIKKDTIDLNT
jgi:hypothetical protein